MDVCVGAVEYCFAVGDGGPCGTFYAVVQAFKAYTMVYGLHTLYQV